LRLQQCLQSVLLHFKINYKRQLSITLIIIGS
jgi:hypothetical protein